MRLVMPLILGLLLTTAGYARVEVHDFDSPDQEQRYNKLIEELRCLVCQNQNLADSNANWPSTCGARPTRWSKRTRPSRR